MPSLCSAVMGKSKALFTRALFDSYPDTIMTESCHRLGSLISFLNIERILEHPSRSSTYNAEPLQGTPHDTRPNQQLQHTYINVHQHLAKYVISHSQDRSSDTKVLDFSPFTARHHALLYLMWGPQHMPSITKPFLMREDDISGTICQGVSGTLSRQYSVMSALT